MGSDSRTATATSSKKRPAWRDKHLKQLNADQLEEVEAHRGNGSAVAGDPADHRTGSNGESKTREMPRAQAGPKRSGQKDEARNERRNQNDRWHSKDESHQSIVRNDQTDRLRPDTDHHSDTDHRYRKGRRDRAPDNHRRSRADGRKHDRSEPHRRLHRQPDRQPHGQSRDDAVRHEHEARSARTSAPTPDDRPHRDRAVRELPVQDRVRSNNERGRARDRSGDRSGDWARGRPGDRPKRWAKQRPEHRRVEERQQPPAAEVRIRKPAVKPHTKENSESFFSRLLSFKVQGPWKYGLMALAIATLVALSFMKPIDNSSQSQLDSALTRAMVGFGLARTLNGVISVAQGTEFAVQPAGVGVNFSPGEILDPINDLVERFSWVMLLATSSLGVQKILLEVSSWMGISMLLAGAGLFFLLTRMRNSALGKMADVAGKILLLMLLVRFLIPLGSLANDWVYRQFLEPHFEQSSQQLEVASERIREISTRQTQDKNQGVSLTERAKNMYNSMTSKFDFDGMLNDYKQSAENVSEHAVNLIVVFLLQTIVFPLLFLYLIYRLFKSVLMPSQVRS